MKQVQEFILGKKPKQDVAKKVVKRKRKYTRRSRKKS